MSPHCQDSALSDILGRSSVRLIGISCNSLGVTNSSAPLILALPAAGKVIAINAGDGGSTQPNTLSISSFNLLDAVIFAATDASGELLAGSNRAGAKSSKYIAINGLIDYHSSAVEENSAFATARLSGSAYSTDFY